MSPYTPTVLNCSRNMSTLGHRLPRLVLAADWSANQNKRWMVRAEHDASDGYLVYPPEPVGEPASLIERLRGQISVHESLLIGFDFPIGLPAVYARQAGVTSFRSALSKFGSDPWGSFYNISDFPSLRQPFSPRPTQKPGNYRAQLASALGCQDLSVMRRRCDLKTATRKAAECLFFTMGSAQVGAGAIVGWRDLIQPSLEDVKLWPFDGELSTLLASPGVTIAEIYPAEAYSHLSVKIGAGTGRTKTLRADRREAAKSWLIEFGAGQIRLSHAAESWIEWGFLAEDDFDAMAGLLSMLRIVTGQRSGTAPKTNDVLQIEGWILGQAFIDLHDQSCIGKDQTV